MGLVKIGFGQTYFGCFFVMWFSLIVFTMFSTGENVGDLEGVIFLVRIFFRR
jgi:hypothetical protein